MNKKRTNTLVRAAAKMLLFAAMSLIAAQAEAQRMSGTWSERGPELGGRLSAIVASHSDPNLLLTASPGGGVWRSTDGGKTWHFPANAGLGDFSVTHLEWDLDDGRRLYALTWNGLYCTTNNGDAWTGLINSGGVAPLRQGELVSVTDPAPFVQMAFSEKERLVLAAIPCSGIYYSFDGTHFTQHWPFQGEAKNPDNCIGTIAADPVSHTIYIASTVRSGPAHLFRSSCGTAAWTPGKPCLTWVPANAGMPANSVVSAMTWVGDRRGPKPGPGALVALVVASGANGLIYVNRNGSSWSSPGPVPTPSWSGRTLVAPGTGQDLFQGNVLSLYSGNLGAAWKTFTVQQQHPDARDIYADPKAGKIWTVTDGAMDSGKYSNVVRWDWKPGSPPTPGTGVDLGYKGLKVWQLYFAGVARTSNPATPVRVFLGSQDNGSLCSDSLGASGWKSSGAPPGGGSGDQFAYQSAPSNPNRAYAWSGTEEGFARTSNAGSAASCDAVAWTFVKPTKTGAAMSPPYFWTHHALAIHPTNPDALYLALNFAVGVITNAGSAAPNLVAHPLPNRAQPTAIYVDAKGAIYAGTQGAGAFLSRDNGNTWTRWALNTDPPFLITAIASSGGNSPTFWIASSSGLYRKLPNAVDWAFSTHPSGYTVSDVKVDPSCPSRVYAAFGFAATWGQHRGGIEFSSDNGATWNSITSGYALHNVPITDIEIDPSRGQRLFAATYGRGFWVYDWGPSVPPCKR